MLFAREACKRIIANKEYGRNIYNLNSGHRKTTDVGARLYLIHYMMLNNR